MSLTIHSRAHVTFDGGRTWSEYPIAFSSTYQATGDPAVAFDAAGHAHYATLGFRFVGQPWVEPRYRRGQFRRRGQDVGTVTQGRGQWKSPGASATSSTRSIAAWGDGNAIVTWGDFRTAPQKKPGTARIWLPR